MQTRAHPHSEHIVSPTAPETKYSAGRAWSVLGVLCFVYILNYLDRQLLSILAKPIQDELGISDGQLGLISGLYFALFYCTLAIPVGWLADKSNRVRVLAAACGLWSLATVGCGVSSSYTHLALSRMAIGVGEAGGVPPSYAIISDYFPRGRRGTALGIFNLGPPIGLAIGVAFGASIAAAYNWRLAFILLGGIGIVTAIGVWIFVREPTRGGLDQNKSDASGASFIKTVKTFFGRPVLLLGSLAGGVTQFVTYGMISFNVLFLMREKGMLLQEVAIWYAIVVGVGVSFGMLFSGLLTDRLTRRSSRAYALVPAAGLVIALPFFVAFTWANDWRLALGFLSIPMVFGFFYLSPAVTMVQEAVQPDERVISGALLLFVMNLIGLGLGPTFVGIASDFFARSNPDNSLQLAFYSLVPFFVIAILLYLALNFALKREETSGSFA